MSQKIPKIAFLGSTKVSKDVLEGLVEAKFVPELLITTPDVLIGRKRILTPNPVKIFAKEHNIAIIEPESLKKETPDELSNAPWDLFIVTSYPNIVPKSIIDIPKHGVLNVHFSLLPLLRGGSPVRTAVLEGFKETGTSIILMDEKLDHGPILAQESGVSVQNREYLDLEGELTNISTRMLIDLIPKWIEGEVEPKEQDHSKATKAPLFVSSDYEINNKTILENANSREVQLAMNKVLAFNPKPVPWTKLTTNKGEIYIKINSAHIEGNKLVPDMVTPEGKKRMEWKSFLNGHQLLN